MLLHPAAGFIAWRKEPRDTNRPTLEEVRSAAQQMREQLWDHAANAAGELGDPAPWIGAREHEVRGYIHDCLHGHHDKDYRLFHAFPIKELQDYTMQFWGAYTPSEPQPTEEPGCRLAGKADREWVTVGWREVLEGEDPAAPLVPSKRPKCARCQEHQEEKVGNRVPKIP